MFSALLSAHRVIETHALRRKQISSAGQGCVNALGAGLARHSLDDAGREETDATRLRTP
jgi:hypothetical protein